MESSKTLPRIFTAAMGAQGRRFRFRNRQKRPGEAAALALAAGQERQARPAVAAALSAIWEQLSYLGLSDNPLITAEAKQHVQSVAPCDVRL